MAVRRVVITGIGTVTPFGTGAKTFWHHISEGDSAASWITSFDVLTLPVKFAAPVPDTDEELQRLIENPKSLKTMSRAAVFAAVAASEAF